MMSGSGTDEIRGDSLAQFSRSCTRSCRAARCRLVAALLQEAVLVCAFPDGIGIDCIQCC